MNSVDFSHANLDAKLVVSLAQEQIRISREKYHAERKEYIDYYYYRKHVRWVNFCNRIKRFFGIKPSLLVDSETYYKEFDDVSISLSEMLSLVMVGAKHDVRIQILNEILPIAEAAMHNDGVVKLTSKHCRALGYGPGLVPIAPEEQERRRAEKELEIAIHG